jgi:hypothetical protein
MADLHVTVKGKRFLVRVNDEGKFYANVGDDDKNETVVSDTFDGIKPLIENVFKKAKVKIAIPVSIYDSGESSWNVRSTVASVEEAVLTGVHSSSRNPLIRRNGKSEQWTSYNEKLLTQLSLDEAEELITARSTIDKAQATIKRITSEHKLDVKAVVEAALKEAGV